MHIPPPYRAERVINGTWGEVWIDSDYIAEILSMKASISFKKESIAQCRQLTDGSKITGIEAKGELKMNKISSRFINLLSDNMRSGKQTEFTIISKIADPDNGGTERVKLIGCVFDELTLIDWELKKMSEESMSFTFRDWEVLERIN